MGFFNLFSKNGKQSSSVQYTAPEVQQISLEEIEHEIISSSIFQEHLAKLRKIKELFEVVIDSEKRDSVNLCTNYNDKYSISVRCLVFDVWCRELEQQRNKVDSREENRKNTYNVLLSICGNDDHIKILTDYMDAEWFLENIQPFGGDWSQDTYDVSFPMKVLAPPIFYENETRFKPHYLEELYLREAKK